jgi:CheY-like chemotaxis protein
MMGGIIGVDSTVGLGSVFWFELNSTSEPQLEADLALPTEIAKAQASLGVPLRTLLYVEDNPANLKLIEQLIARRPDICLLSARDGNTGIQLARANQPTLILMDINLPGISGIEALKILREDPAGRILPLSDQAHQDPGVHGHARSSTQIRGTRKRPEQVEPNQVHGQPSRHSERQDPGGRR